MSSESQIAKPFFLQGSRGRVAAVHFRATGNLRGRGGLLFVPPFGEEMNRSRSMLALQARELARVGIDSLILDPLGTGDSEGEFSDATWSAWREDLSLGADWLAQASGRCRWILGVRVGALMAAELVRLHPSVERLFFWQPVVRGDTFFTNFLRIRVAADFQLADGVRSTDELRASLARGEPVDVSGYRVNGDLAASLDGASLNSLAPPETVDVTWMEVVSTADARPPRANMTLASAWEASGVKIDHSTIVGPPFWQVHERELAPDLVAATTARLATATATVANAGSISGPGAEQSGPAIEQALAFDCEGSELVGIVHRVKPSAAVTRRGVIIVVAGGPQYRVGAHRQFATMARLLAAQGYCVLRFDLRGMGDSSGSYRGFQESEPDIRAAIDALLRLEPTLNEIVLLGECESASGILFYAWRDSRVSGIALVNPWVRTEEGQAQVIVKHYYLDRLKSREFWRKLGSGSFNWRDSFRSLVQVLRAYWRGRRINGEGLRSAADSEFSALPLPLKTAEGLRRFGGKVMLLMSGRDYIAREFDEVTSTSLAWAGLLESRRVTRHDLADADHTFSRPASRAQAVELVAGWLESW